MSVNTSQNIGYVQYLATLVGTSEPALRLLLTILIGYPLSMLYRQFIYNKSILINHLFIIASGITICLFNYGYELYHSLIAIFMSYLLITLFNGTKYLVTTTFLFHMTYLLIGYYKTGTETYDIKWTMPHCVLVLRLIGLAFDVADGHLPEGQLSKDNKVTALKRAPNLLEIASYTYFPASVLVGPQFPFSRYNAFITKQYDQYKGYLSAGLKRGGIGLTYLAMHQIGSLYFSDAYIQSEEYANRCFLTKITILALWGKFTLYKYISCWLLSEGVCICFGLTFVKKNPDGSEDWSGCENIRLKVFENAGELKDYVASFNVNTNHWVSQYIYKRLKFLGNRHLSHFGTLLFLAIWHGFHSGYYACFFSEFVIITLEKDIEQIIKGRDAINKILGNPIIVPFKWIFLKFYQLTYMGWSLIPFVFLGYGKYIPVYRSVNYFGFALYVPLAIILKLVGHKLVKRPKSE